MFFALLVKMALAVSLGLGGNGWVVSSQNPKVLLQGVEEIASVAIFPDSVELELEEVFEFRAAAYNQSGEEVEYSPLWLTTGGEITQSGVYTATIPGCYEVLVTDAHTGLYAVAEVHISCHQSSDACLVVDPARIQLTKGEEYQFAAYGYDETDGLVPISVEWHSGGGWIDENGLYTASDVGDFLITATQVGSGKYGTAHVSVKTISLLPPWMYLESGKMWFGFLGVLIGMSFGMGYYLYHRRRYMGYESIDR